MPTTPCTGEPGTRRYVAAGRRKWDEVGSELVPQRQARAALDPPAPSLLAQRSVTELTAPTNLWYWSALYRSVSFATVSDCVSARSALPPYRSRPPAAKVRRISHPPAPGTMDFKAADEGLEPDPKSKDLEPCAGTSSLGGPYSGGPPPPQTPPVWGCHSQLPSKRLREVWGAAALPPHSRGVWVGGRPPK